MLSTIYTCIMPVLSYTDVQQIENYRVRDVLYGKKMARARELQRVQGRQRVYQIEVKIFNQQT